MIDFNNERSPMVIISALLAIALAGGRFFGPCIHPGLRAHQSHWKDWARHWPRQPFKLSENTGRLFAAGVLHTALLPRWEPSPETAPLRTPAEWFARYFLVVTPANIDVLPKPSS